VEEGEEAGEEEGGGVGSGRDVSMSGVGDVEVDADTSVANASITADDGGALELLFQCFLFKDPSLILHNSYVLALRVNNVVESLPQIKSGYG